jgi:UDP-N-acetylmuramoylalanine--D-glutamate ligase
VGNPASNFANVEGIFLLEVSSFQLHSTEFFRPDVAAILNLSEDHMDWHGDLRSYAEAKARIFTCQGPNDVLILNADDPNTRAMESRARSRVLFFSLERAVRGAYLNEGALILDTGEVVDNLIQADELNISGLHNISNALAASLITHSLGAEPDEIRRTLRSFPGLPHRMEFVRDMDGIRIINDSKSTNPHSVLWGVRSVEGPVVLIMGGLDKDLDFRGLRKSIGEKARALVVLGQAAPKLESVFGDIVPVRRAIDLEDSIRTALTLAEKGDTVLFSPGCASFDMFRNYKDRGNRFKAAVRGM